ncbi:unnamed protein product, partial [Onchocerca ochengi]|uniref:SCP domain-containing protein n=1 Tax=Onchocerca ochengi TaxID=42157 RepID=A0A182EZP0_ONCOC
HRKYAMSQIAVDKMYKDEEEIWSAMEYWTKQLKQVEFISLNNVANFYKF